MFRTRKQIARACGCREEDIAPLISDALWNSHYDRPKFWKGVFLSVVLSILSAVLAGAVQSMLDVSNVFVGIGITILVFFSSFHLTFNGAAESYVVERLAKR